jgi:hypothetical protein
MPKLRVVLVLVLEGSGSLFRAEVPQIEHEHTDEHEHDS